MPQTNRVVLGKCNVFVVTMVTIFTGLRPFCVWWGDQRIDYQLQAPLGLEHGDTLPVSNTAYAHIAQARYWEAKEMVSFVLRQVC